MAHPRRARRLDAKVAAARDPDLMLSKLGMKRGAKVAGRSKSLNENLAPLRRYLESQVNRPWDKVWSDICENLSTASTVQQHVRDHIVDFVGMHSFIRGGVVFVAPRHGGLQPLAESGCRLYVDPRSGLLRKNKHYESWQKKRREMNAAADKHRATRMRELGPNLQAHKLDDNCWWEIRLAPIPTRKVTYSDREFVLQAEFTDVVKRAKLSKLSAEAMYGKPGVYAAAKRQLSRNEIRDLALED
ncbi:MAG TPA: hypothetical protein VJT13_22105 [Xanthobacteraceae bacterium]|nr:hypothetical protein [Xanthobacteraceae bacterium]